MIVEIPSEIVLKICQVYEHGTEEDLEKIKQMFHEQRPFSYDEERDIVVYGDDVTFISSWKEVFKARKHIKKMAKENND